MQLEPWPIPSGWASLIDEYGDASRGAGHSRETVKMRRTQLAHLARGLGGEPWAVTLPQLLGFVGRQDWSVETRRSRRTTYRGFWAWGVGMGYAGDNIAARLPRVKPAEPVPMPIPPAALAEALGRADEREWLILRLAVEAGLRRAEIARIHVGRDLVRDLLGWSLVVHGKGGKVRVLPLPASLAMALLARGQGHAFEGAIDGHLSARRVGELAQGVLPAPWTIHKLRHRFATDMHDEYRNLEAVRKLLGHASVATTQRYVATDDAVLRAMMERRAL